MKKPYWVLVLLIAACCIADAQKLNTSKTGKTFAVVIGISEYADERIPDLQFAHRDAETYAAFLQSPAGGSLPKDQIKLLTNERATMGLMVAAFEWLISESQTGDRAIIYFSGHGDVERMTLAQQGYLLAHDAPGTTYMAGGALNVRDLQWIITTMSDANIEVIVISDACRAGNLAGSDTGGSQKTNAALTKQFANEIKILSCQPEEFSIEGEQWGGGRGCFSYHLTDGLIGMADQDHDLKVDLREIGRYLQDKVSTEADPNQQMPMTVGNAYASVSNVDESTLATLKERKHGEAPLLLSIKSKGLEEMLLADTDSSVQELYYAFVAAVEKGDLMAPIGQSANDYYEQLMQIPHIAKLQGTVKRNFAAALQDEAQVVVNKLLRTDPQIVDDAFHSKIRYDHIPVYLEKATEILGATHYMYPYLKAKQYFFKSKTYRQENYPELSPDTLVTLSLISLDSALVYDSTAAYVFMEKGQFCFWNDCQPTFTYENALEASEKAVQLSPKWVIPTYYTGRWYSWLGKREKGDSLLKQAVILDSMFLPTYWLLAFESDGEKRKYYYQQYVNKMQEFMANHPDHVPIVYYRYFGFCLSGLERYEEAEQVLLKAADLTNNQDPFILNALTELYFASSRYFNKLEKYCLYFHQQNCVKNHENACRLYRFYCLTHQFEESKRIGREHVSNIEKELGSPDWGYGRWYYGSPTLAESAIKEHVRKAEASGNDEENAESNCPLCPYGLLVLANLAQNDLKEAEYWWEKRNKQDASYNFGWSDGFGYGLHTWLAYAQGEYEEVDSLIEHYSSIVPVDDLIEDMLLLISIADQVDYAIYIFEKSTKYFPEKAPLHYHLARIYIEQKNNYVKGVPLLEQAVLLDADYVYAHYHLANAYARLDKLEAAMDHLERALQKGYDGTEKIKTDPAFEKLRETRRFKKLISQYPEK